MGLILLANVKTLLGIDSGDTSQDAALNIHIDQCSARIETFCKRIFAAADYTEYLQGNGDKFLVTGQRPINTVASVYEDTAAMWGQAPDAFAAATLLVAGTDYAIVKDQPNGASKSGRLYRINSVWPKPLSFVPGLITGQNLDGVGNVKVTYNAGFSTIPSDLQQACYLLIVAVRRIAKIGVPTTSEGWEDYNYAVQQAASDAIGALPPDTLATLIRYRNNVVG